MKRIFLAIILIVSFVFCSCTAKPKVNPSANPSLQPSLQPTATPSVTPTVSPSTAHDLPLVDFSTQTPLSLYQKAAEYLRATPYYRAEGKGKVKNTLSTQNMLTLFEKDGDQTLNRSYSSGFVNQATEITSQAGTVTLREGKYNDKTGTASYGSPQTLTEDAFREAWGGESNFPFCYLITEQTLLSSFGEAVDTAAEASLHNRSAVYSVTLQLDPTAATKEYQKRMQKSGDISAPTFRSVKLTFTVDAYGRFVSFTIQEEYTVKIIFRVKCEMQLTHDFYYEK